MWNVILKPELARKKLVFLKKVWINSPYFSLLINRSKSLSASKKSSNKDDVPSKSLRADANFDTLGVWNYKLDLEVNLDLSIETGILTPSIGIENVGFNSLLGRRHVNEDRFLVKQLTPQVQLFAIFDGHGSPEAAKFAAEYMPNHIQFWLNHESCLHKILKYSFAEVNNAFGKYVYSNCLDSVDAGTTATVCLFRNSRELVVGHVGDSKAFMCRYGKVVRLTIDHKPDDVKENERILSSGGHIIWTSIGKGRVNGKLDMTRSIGDFDLKQYGVISDPITRSIQVKHGKDAFLVLTTDGISCVMSDQEIVDSIASCEDPDEAALVITDQALHFGSLDNVTSVIVPFGAWGKFAKSSRTTHFTFGRNIIGGRYA